MIDNTASFKRLKYEQQRIIDFVILVTSSVPSLKKSIKGFEENVPNYDNLANNDYFSKISIKQLKNITCDYKINLSKYILISTFSFFENYIFSALKELITFHKGKDNLVKRIIETNREYIRVFESDNIIKKNRDSLCVPFKKTHIYKYIKYLNFLKKDNNYIESVRLLDCFGLKHLIELIENDNLSACMIPDILEYALCIDLSNKINLHPKLKKYNIRETIDIIRDARNCVAHGDKHPKIDLELVMNYNNFLRDLSIQIDKRIVDIFMVIF